QNTQNRDTAAMQIKLDELIRAMKGAHNALLDLEELEEKDLSRFRKHYEKLADEARTALRAAAATPIRRSSTTTMTMMTMMTSAEAMPIAMASREPSRYAASKRAVRLRRASAR
ncbi:MAG: putative small integral rane protein precursor, partial [Caballeronia sp.]|nr:putative small integral rane protein precursor [Caballeronia sp.]